MSKNSENEIDILDINNRILGNFEKKKQTLGKLKERLQDMNKSLEIENIRHGVKDTLQNNISDIKDYIKDIEENISLNFYMLESVDLVEKYKEILNSPLKMSFVGKISKNNREKNNIINQYLEVASKYIDLNMNIEKK